MKRVVAIILLLSLVLPGTALARYYDAGQGRFLSQDQYEGKTDDAPSLNRYAYARSNPLKYWDADGHNPLLVALAIVFILTWKSDEDATIAAPIAVVNPGLGMALMNAQGGAQLASGKYKEAEESFATSLLVGASAELMAAPKTPSPASQATCEYTAVESPSGGIQLKSVSEPAAASKPSTSRPIAASQQDVAPAGARGPTSGREFDPEQAGGPIRNLNTDQIKITEKGASVVAKHTSRFGPDQANEVMQQRLSKIAAGETETTQQDLNYYSHELREYTRYRRLGYETGEPPEEMSREVWNNAHTATLEDYRLSSSIEELYHPEALQCIPE